MKISTMTRYGTRALTELARACPGESVSVTQMARDQQISVKYLERIMAALKQAGLVTSTRGAGGGYSLAREPGRIRLLDVFIALEGEPAIVHCVSRDGSCPRETACPTRDLWREMTRSLVTVLEQTTLEDIGDCDSLEGKFAS